MLVQYKEKKKVGRPITYKGDPEANDLTEEERRRIKRRIANRESARRVRQKRHDLMDDLQVNVRESIFIRPCHNILHSSSPCPDQQHIRGKSNDSQK